jgi:hypothetical protein
MTHDAPAAAAPAAPAELAADWAQATPVARIIISVRIRAQYRRIVGLPSYIHAVGRFCLPVSGPAALVDSVK